MFLILFLSLFLIPANAGSSILTVQKLQPYDIPSLTDYIAQQIYAAEKTVELTIYDFNSDKIYEAIKYACSNGVKFRAYADWDENKDSNSDLSKLVNDEPDNIQVIFDSWKVHSKWVMIDGHQLLMGSNNWDDDEPDNIEFLLISNDPSIIQQLQTKFDYVFPNKWNTPPPPVDQRATKPEKTKSKQNQVFYERGISDEYVKIINSTKQSIEGAVFKLTSEIFFRALRFAALRNVTIKLYLDGDNNDFDNSYSQQLKSEFGNHVTLVYSDKDVKMHCKFLIFDGKMVTMGSANWSPGVESNLEDLLVSTDPQLVKQAQHNLAVLINQNP